MLREEKEHSSHAVSRNGKLERFSACKKQLASVYWRRTDSFRSSPRLFIRGNSTGEGFLLPGPVHSEGVIEFPLCLCIVGVSE